MLAKEELVSALNGESDSQPPAVFTQSATVQAMERCGCPWPEAHTDPEMMAVLARQLFEMTGIPTARIPFSIATEAMALGCEVDMGGMSAYPSVRGNPWTVDGTMPDVPDTMIPVDSFLSGEGVSAVVSALEILSSDESLFTVVGVSGPFDLMVNMFGLDSAVMCMLLEPDRFRSWASRIVPYLEAYLRAVDGIADSVLVIESATTDILSPDDYDSFVADNLSRVLHVPRSSMPMLHCCGSTLEMAERLAACGEKVLVPQASGHLYEYVSRIAGRVVLAGAVDPVGTMLSGTPADVVRASRLSADAGFDVVAPECGLSPMTPTANIDALAHYREHPI